MPFVNCVSKKVRTSLEVLREGAAIAALEIEIAIKSNAGAIIRFIWKLR